MLIIQDASIRADSALKTSSAHIINQHAEPAKDDKKNYQKHQQGSG
ncbi:MAG: hypothetical protein KFF74_00520 [Candidatus Nanosynbacter sp.]|nr:hypothetical protein [Candidatus Nanosynbacter sp.]